MVATSIFHGSWNSRSCMRLKGERGGVHLKSRCCFHLICPTWTVGAAPFVLTALLSAMHTAQLTVYAKSTLCNAYCTVDTVCWCILHSWHCMPNYSLQCILHSWHCMLMHTAHLTLYAKTTLCNAYCSWHCKPKLPSTMHTAQLTLYAKTSLCNAYCTVDTVCQNYSLQCILFTWHCMPKLLCNAYCTVDTVCQNYSLQCILHTWHSISVCQNFSLPCILHTWHCMPKLPSAMHTAHLTLYAETALGMHTAHFTLYVINILCNAYIIVYIVCHKHSLQYIQHSLHCMP